jgi:hypothetical protein
MKGNHHGIAMYKIKKQVKFLFLKNEIHLDQEFPIQRIMKRINFESTLIFDLYFTIYNKLAQKEVII